MRTLLTLAAAVAVATVAIGSVGSCKAGWDDVPTNALKPSKDYPCGIIGVPCTDSVGKLNGECCWQGETCGGGLGSVGCPAGGCCDVRPLDQDTFGAKRDGGGDGNGITVPTVRHVQSPAPSTRPTVDP